MRSDILNFSRSENLAKFEMEGRRIEVVLFSGGGSTSKLQEQKYHRTWGNRAKWRGNGTGLTLSLGGSPVCLPLAFILNSEHASDLATT